jgi:hypothetical protein
MRTQSVQQQVVQILHTIDTYIVKDCAHEINIESNDKAELLQIVATSNQRKTLKLAVPTTLFDKLYPLVMHHVKEDLFPRFIRSAYLTKFAKEKGEAFMKQNGIYVQAERKDVLIQADDLRATTISSKDVILVRSLLEDSHQWQAVRVPKYKEIEQDYYTYISKSMIKMETAKEYTYIFKYTGYLPCSAKEAIAAIYHSDSQKIIEPKVERSTKEIFKAGNENHIFNCELYHEVITSKFKKHEFYGLKTILYDPVRRCYTCIRKSSTAFKDKYTSRKDCTNATLMIGETFYAISENRCRYAIVSWTEMEKSKLLNGEKLVSRSAKNRGKKLHEEFTSSVANMREKGFPIAQDALHVIDNCTDLDF